MATTLSGCSTPGLFCGALQIGLGKRMPTTDGHLEVPGITDRVLIRRDAFGIPHIDARNEPDAWYAWGFCQGQDRAFQIETRVRVVRGRLAELIGPEGLPVDRLSRRMGLARHAQAQYEVLNDHGRSTIEAFCRGVIEGSRIGATRRAHEFRLLNVRPTPLEPSDVLGSLALVSFLLASNWDSEIGRLKVLQADGPDALKALDPTYPEWLSIISRPGEPAARRSRT
ncbi:MAG: penicillin acylase family protein [Acidimicrobiia bacterium]|nr:penicillin acylase family protein [Acidimicrobiia bacterium]